MEIKSSCLLVHTCLVYLIDVAYSTQATHGRFSCQNTSSTVRKVILLEVRAGSTTSLTLLDCKHDFLLVLDVEVDRMSTLTKPAHYD